MAAQGSRPARDALPSRPGLLETLPRQNDYLVEAGYYLSTGKLQPFGRWELEDASELTLAMQVWYY